MSNRTLTTRWYCGSQGLNSLAKAVCSNTGLSILLKFTEVPAGKTGACGSRLEIVLLGATADELSDKVSLRL